MEIAKVHCLFEQSGTFKNEFKKLGYHAEDYDILNDFGETDNVVDLFAEIEKAYADEQSIFDNFSPNDLILAFFPCTRFEANITLHYRGEVYQMQKWSDKQNLNMFINFIKNLICFTSCFIKCIAIALIVGYV